MQSARLIVKNFGPLKDIDIEVRDFLCLIGKQATGKSTIAKLIAIFEDEKLLFMDTKSQIKIHNLTGWVVPEVAAREHANAIFEVLENVLIWVNLKIEEIDYNKKFDVLDKL